MNSKTPNDDAMIYRWKRWKLFEQMVIGLVMILIFGFLFLSLWRMPFSLDIWSILFAMVAFPFCGVFTAMGVYVFVDACLLLLSRHPALILDVDGFSYFRSMTLLPPFRLMRFMRIPFLRVWSIEKQDFEFRGQSGEMLNVSYQLDGMLKSKRLIIHTKLIRAKPGEVETRMKQMWQTRKQDEPIDWTTQRW